MVVPVFLLCFSFSFVLSFSFHSVFRRVNFCCWNIVAGALHAALIYLIPQAGHVACVFVHPFGRSEDIVHAPGVGVPDDDDENAPVNAAWRWLLLCLP